MFYAFSYYKNSLKSFTVVIARYNENLDWVAKEFPNQNVIIYNKGNDDIKALPNWQIVKLHNIGRESHTYLYHIVINYHNLADRTLFLQGYPYDHLGDVYTPLLKYKTKIFVHLFNKCRNIIGKCGNNITSKIKSYFKSDYVDRYRLDALSVYLEGMIPYLSSKNVIIKENTSYNNLSSFIRNVLGKNLDHDTVLGWAFGAQFAVDKEFILKHNIESYQNLLKYLDNQNPLEGYFFEKSWDIIFDNGNYKEITK